MRRLGILQLSREWYNSGLCRKCHKLLSSYRISLKIWTLCWQACFILWFPRKCLNATIAASNDPTVSNLSLKRQLVYSVVIVDYPMAKLSQPKLLLNQTHKMSRNGSHSDCHPSGDGIWLSSLAHLCPKTHHTRGLATCQTFPESK